MAGTSGTTTLIPGISSSALNGCSVTLCTERLRYYFSEDTPQHHHCPEDPTYSNGSSRRRDYYDRGYDRGYDDRDYYSRSYRFVIWKATTFLSLNQEEVEEEVDGELLKTGIRFTEGGHLLLTTVVEDTGHDPDHDPTHLVAIKA
ncbi:Transformer-2 protein-like protein beta [Sciurus carolinensis]|uniref:Transformer-2 protein-like protein beta n=1 Tax=Sciurus carolinensis TaxID=30640 RepID=A0AA41N013_SCICA|nr:Transformer-2 protein-like protein beta [Sciurus carolinensis]